MGGKISIEKISREIYGNLLFFFDQKDVVNKQWMDDDGWICSVIDGLVGLLDLLIVVLLNYSIREKNAKTFRVEYVISCLQDRDKII